MHIIYKLWLQVFYDVPLSNELKHIPNELLVFKSYSVLVVKFNMFLLCILQYSTEGTDVCLCLSSLLKWNRPEFMASVQMCEKITRFYSEINSLVKAQGLSPETI